MMRKLESTARWIRFWIFVLVSGPGFVPPATASAQPSPLQAFDRYGGTLAISSQSTGFFRTAKMEGRWWLVTPDGHGFLSAGVNHVDYKEDYSPEFVDFVSSYLREWGFNTIGWSQESMSTRFVIGELEHSPGWGPQQYRRAGMPYTHLIRFTDMEWYVRPEFPDVFSEAFATRCDRLAREVCSQLRQDPYLIGYFYSDAPNWPLWARKVGSDQIGVVARQYYRVIHDAIRRYDPNHLLLGDRLKADASIPLGAEKVRGVLGPVLEAMKDTVDVLSLEYYRPEDELEANLERWSGLVGKPVLMADSAFLAPTEVLDVSPESPLYVPTQAARGQAYREHALRLYSNPSVIGYHWCAFGRSRGRRSGLLDGGDHPYQAAVSRMREFNLNDLYRAARSGAPFDPDLQRDLYGGTRAVGGEATGFFRVKKVGSRWWLITPEGSGFISMGMNHFDLAALKHEDNVHLFRSRYDSSNDRFIEKGIARPLRDWGFNTIGWTQESVGGRWMDPTTVLRHSPEWSHREFQLAGLPFVYNLHFADIENFNMNPSYPDVFSGDFEAWADYVARSACLDLAGDPLLVGYADVPVPGFTRQVAGSWAEKLDLTDPGDLEKLKRIVRRYFQVTTAAIRRYDPNHLIFGPRLDHPDQVPEWILEIAGEYLDVLLANRFLSVPEVENDLKHWHEISGRPVIISDFAYLAPTELLDVSPSARSYVPDQRARGEAFQQFASHALQQPFVVGLHWCAFIENRARKSGIKNYLDEPYQELVTRMRAFNRDRLYKTALERFEPSETRDGRED